MANFSTTNPVPALTTAYTDVLVQLNSKFTDVIQGLDPAVATSITNVPASTIRWSSASNKWQKWSGTVWNDLSALYAINISGNAASASNASTVTDGVYTTGDQTITGTKTFASSVGIGTSATTSGKLTVATDGVALASQMLTATGSIQVLMQNHEAAAAFQAINYGSSYVGGSAFGVGAGGTALVQTANAPLGIGTLGVSQPLIFGTNGFERARIHPSGGISVGSTADPGATNLRVAGTIFGTLSGNAATVTDGVYTTGNQTIAGEKTFSRNISVNGVLVGRGTGGDPTNTAIGGMSLLSNDTGRCNTAIGSFALYSNRTGSGNTALSPQTSGGVLSPVFNPTTENNRFCMGSTAVTNAYIQVAWTVVSDARDKTDFAAVPHGLAFVCQLKPFAYRYKMDRAATEGHGPVRYGFKAQDVLAIEGSNPVIVDAEDPEKLRFNDQSLLAVLVNAIQELKAEFDAYKAAHP